MEELDRASIDLPAEPAPPAPPPDVSGKPEPEPPLRWPKWTWPFGVLVRGVPMAAGIILFCEAVVRLGPLAGLTYFGEIGMEERAVYRIAVFVLVLAAVGCWLGLRWSWSFLKALNAKPGSLGKRAARAALVLALLPFTLAVTLAWTVLRNSGAAVLGMATNFLGVCMPNLPMNPPIKHLTWYCLIVAAVAGAGALVIGLRYLWRGGRYSGSRGRRLAAAGGWLAAGTFSTVLGVQIATNEFRLAELERRVEAAPPAEEAALLADALRDPYDRTRLYAAGAFERVAELAPGSIPALTEALADPNTEVRTEAMRVLVQLAEPAALPAMFAAATRRRPLLLLEDLDSHLRWDLIQGLRSFETAGVTPYLKSPDPKVREVVLYAFYFHNGSCLPTPQLLEFLASPLDQESSLACSILKARAAAEPGMLERMMALARDPRERYARRALEIMGEMGPLAKDAAPLLSELAAGAVLTLRWPATLALFEIGEPARPALVAEMRKRTGEDRMMLESALKSLDARIRKDKKAKLPAEAEPLPAEEPEIFAIELRPMYDGRPLEWPCFAQPPKINLFHQLKRTTVKGGPDEEGRLLVPRVYPGACQVSIHVDAVAGEPEGYPGPGDYWGTAQIKVKEGANAPFEIEVQRVLRLLSPDDNGHCMESLPNHAGKTRFAWEGLGEGVSYRVMQHGAKPYSYQERTLQTTEIETDLGPGEFNFDVTAMRGSKSIGHLYVNHRHEHNYNGTPSSYVTTNRGYDYRAMPAEGVPVDLAGRLLFEGQALTQSPGPAPVFKVKDLMTGKPVDCRVEWNAPAFRIPALPPSAYEVTAVIDADPANPPFYPGDYCGRGTCSLRADRNIDTPIHMMKVLRLLKPEDSHKGIAFFPAKKEPRKLESPVTVAWEPMGDGIEYQVIIYPGGEIRRTAQTEITVDLPAGATACNLQIHAYRKHQQIGELVLDGENLNHFYPFQISAP
ncbi:MAG: HEAT repeat domain-containing protein [Planctomycetes bacterium]|nr:HEAT repeat domain-containing protein [Planctomycetota bacterium]